ncbi:MAG: type II toxin-antitoxin system Phd/YefM family antitoxin [Thermodesulfovibrionales bacterium]
MKLSEAVKPISYFKAHASEVIRDVSESSNPVVITLNGEAKVILQDIKEYERTQQSLALLKILAQSTKSLQQGKVKPAGRAFAGLRARISGSQK